MAAGVGLAYHFEKKQQVVVVFFGDGAANQGSFHESMNLCSIWKLPVIFFCENNHYASSTQVEYASSVEDISVRAQSYNVPGVTVNGMDVLEVREVADQAIERARKGEGPTLIEGKTYRFYGHSRSDPKFGLYRSEKEWDKWKERDPLLVAEEKLGISPEEKIKHWGIVEKQIADAVAFAETSPEPSDEEVFEDLYA